MLNHEVWVKQAKSFLESLRQLPGMHLELAIAPPAYQTAIDACQKSLSVQIPEPMQRFLLTGSADFSASFRWDAEKEQRQQLSDLIGQSSIYGELHINLEEFADHQVGCKAWGSESFDRSVRNGWLHTFPFARLGNGDYLSLDTRVPESPVLYLTHDNLEELHSLANNFDQFLIQMGKLCFIQIWFWQSVIDAGNLTKLHRLFGFAESN